MFTTIKNFFNNSIVEQNTNVKLRFSVSSSLDIINEPLYPTITQAIEATQGKIAYIHEKVTEGTLYKGMWKEYILQKDDFK